MNRRDFLKIFGVTFGMLTLMQSPKLVKQMASEPQGQAGAKLYRGTQNGKIFKSENKGRTWKLHTNLGDQYTVMGFSDRQDGKITAHVSYQLRDFDLQLSQDERFWLLV